MADTRTQVETRRGLGLGKLLLGVAVLGATYYAGSQWGQKALPGCGAKYDLGTLTDVTDVTLPTEPGALWRINNGDVCAYGPGGKAVQVTGFRVSVHTPENPQPEYGSPCSLP